VLHESEVPHTDLPRAHTQVLASDLLVYEKAETERCLIQTIPSGTIHMSLSVMLRNFDDFFLDR